MDFSAYLEVAIRAAKVAGQIQREHVGVEIEISSKSVDSDLVTIVDAKCEEIIRKLILEAFPGHQILGEEGGSIGSSEFVWIVDPLDGTVNYAHGFPFYCVSIALEIEGSRVVGVVYDPIRDELFSATRDGGAFLNGHKIKVSSQSTLNGRAMLATGFPYDTGTAMLALEVFKRFLALGLPIRRPGAAALDLCYVACGRIDGFFEYKLNAWDCAAGILLIEEAGGQVSNFKGQSYAYSDKKIVASNKILHQAMIDTITESI